MSKLNYKLFFKKRKQRISFFGVSPSFDWKFILGIAMILFLVGVAHVTFLYVQITNGSLFEVVEDEQIELIIKNQTVYIEDTLKKVDLYYKEDTTLIGIEEVDNFDELRIN